ncbi:DUF1214 domain-containing protein [Microbacterium thalassium]|uniref:DUF1254 domain-containing protein n=1 Tax=Microbacterium thalassium TaxID=362649 RepID=A0A7X0FMN5_9MICO|nr:DUF1254 domain-containing protein [Microbacterium thalassium]MBB6390239.1 hypothetical protein [Microbacterium thalassium]GLK25348.1 hypothetical protein GCM10017607_26670 [Microbacterium thalassium]
MSIHVNVDNFVRAETDRMFAGMAAVAGGVGVFGHHRAPTPIDQQTVIRMNRDTLYSFALIDVSQGATVTLPDAGDRYLSAMVVNQDHYVMAIHHAAGDFSLTAENCGSDYALVAVRILVDPLDPADLDAVAALQDGLRVAAGASRPFVMPDYDTASMDATREALLALAAGMSDYERAFGTPHEVDPVRHLVGTASGWGGLPNSEAIYSAINPGLEPGEYTLVMRDVPVDAFWSVSVYDAGGFFAENPAGRYTVNSVTGIPDADGAVTVRFTADRETTAPNAIPVPEGWNAVVRFYRPRGALADGSWTLPAIEPVG